MANSDRIQFSYNSLRGGFKEGTSPIPKWEDAPSWVRDVVTVAYIQGKLDATEPERK